MTQQSTKSMWTTAMLFGLVPLAYGQQSVPPGLRHPANAAERPGYLQSRTEWMGRLAPFQFSSKNSSSGVEGNRYAAASGAPPAGAATSPAGTETPAAGSTWPPEANGKSLPLEATPGETEPSANTADQVMAASPSAGTRTAVPAAPDERSSSTFSGDALLTGSGIPLDPRPASPSPSDQQPEPVQKQPLAADPFESGKELIPETAYAVEKGRMFVQLDLLTWSVSAPDTVVVGDAASEGTVNVGGNSYVRTNSLDTGFITSNWTLGGRVDFGRIDDQRGWMGSVLFYRHDDLANVNGVWFVPNDPDGLLDGYQDSNNDGIDDDVNNNRIHGRSGEDLGTPDNNNPGSFIAPFDGTPDQGAPIDAGDMVTWLVTFSTLTATNSVDLTGFELVDVFRPGGHQPRSWEWFYGMRYLEFREKFGVVASGGTLDTSMWDVDSDNDIIGPQVGLRWTANREWFRMTAEGRFLAGANFQHDRLNGGIATNATPGGSNAPVALEANSFNALQNNTDFSPVGEWRLDASYYVSSWLALRIGYSGMAIGGVSRASQKIAYNLPSFGLTESGSGETVLINGLNVGIEINR